MEPRAPTVELRSYEVLPDGSELVVRPLHPADRDLLALGFERLGPNSRYQRFFTQKPLLSAEELTYLCAPDGDRHYALGIVAWDEQGKEQPVAVARYVRLPDRPELAEAAVTVVDAWQRRGLGRLLIRHLVAAARAHGVLAFRCQVLENNVGIHKLMRAVDAQPRLIAREPGAQHYELSLTRSSRPSTPPPPWPTLGRVA